MRYSDVSLSVKNGQTIVDDEHIVFFITDLYHVEKGLRRGYEGIAHRANRPSK